MNQKSPILDYAPGERNPMPSPGRIWFISRAALRATVYSFLILLGAIISVSGVHQLWILHSWPATRLGDDPFSAAFAMLVLGALVTVPSVRSLLTAIETIQDDPARR